jgi:hypothetical protein
MGAIVAPQIGPRAFEWFVHELFLQLGVQNGFAVGELKEGFPSKGYDFEIKTKEGLVIPVEVKMFSRDIFLQGYRSFVNAIRKEGLEYGILIINASEHVAQHLARGLAESIDNDIQVSIVGREYLYNLLVDNDAVEKNLSNPLCG